MTTVSLFLLRAFRSSSLWLVFDPFLVYPSKREREREREKVLGTFLRSRTSKRLLTRISSFRRRWVFFSLIRKITLIYKLQRALSFFLFHSLSLSLLITWSTSACNRFSSPLSPSISLVRKLLPVLLNYFLPPTSGDDTFSYHLPFSVSIAISTEMSLSFNFTINFHDPRYWCLKSNNTKFLLVFLSDNWSIFILYIYIYINDHTVLQCNVEN